MTTNDRKADDMLLQQLIQLGPEFNIFDGLFVGCLPVSSLPAGEPLLASPSDIFAVGDNFNLRTSFQSGQTLNHRLEFHAVIGGLGRPAGLFKLAPRLGMPQDEGPTSRSRIA